MNTYEKTQDTIFFIFIVLAMIMWGASWASAKVLSVYAEPELLVLIRFIITFLSFIPLLIISKTRLRISGELLIYIVFCAFLMSFYNQMFFKGVRSGYAGLGGVLVTTLSPVITFSISSVFSKTRMLKKEVMGLSAGFAGGLVLLRIWELDFNSLVKTGNIFFLAAALIWAILTLVNTRALLRMQFFAYSFYLYLFTSLFNLVFCLAKYKSFNIIYGTIESLFAGDVKFTANMLFISLLATTFATSMYFTASRKIGGNRASSFMFIVPCTALFFSWIFLGEKIEISTIIGGVSSVIAVYSINHKKK